ncbi:MAG: LysR family transcriptional regulator [Oligoflexia bacterium]|nr:LysR family transcriptional regulator [Oligoflexia bacterium]
MDYRYLKAFLETAKSGSFTVAARQLRVAQSAVSRQIRLLEESLGVQLLVRSPRRVLLTEEGRRLYEEARRFDSWVGSSFRAGRATLSIGALPGILDSWVLPRLEGQISRLPFNLRLIADSREGLLTRLQQGEIEMALIDRMVDTETLTSRFVMDEEFVLISKKPVPSSELHRQRWIYPGEGEFLRRLTRKEPEAFIRIEYLSISAISRLVEAGAGIAVVPRHSLPPKFRGHVAALPAIRSGKIFLVNLNYRRLPPDVKALSDLLLQA